MIANISKAPSDRWALAVPAANAVIALLALLLSSLALYEVAHLRIGGQLTQPATAAAAKDAATPIVPSPVIDPGAERFIGTGDNSNGSWTRP
jgi:hypothetical protein